MAHNGGKWTDARFRAFIVSSLRSATRRWPPKYECAKDAATTKKVNKKTKRVAQHYLCNVCKKEFPRTSIEIDHIDPVGSFTSWDTFIEKLFCEKENLQAVCKICHKKKTLKENNASKKRTRVRRQDTDL